VHARAGEAHRRSPGAGFAGAEQQARENFSEEELVNLTYALVAINGANRLNVAFRTVPGNYQVRRRAAE
jgi:alkylhydroperoxidase family enzyme